MVKIIVCGYMVRYPIAGNILAYFQYVLGLYRLGYEVIYLEESGWPYSCYDPHSAQWLEYPHTGLQIVRRLFSEHGLTLPLWYVDRVSHQVDGASWDELEQALRSADLLLNVGGVCWLPEFELCGCRALVDMDPLFSQVGGFGARLSNGYGAYHTHFSYGCNIGQPGCSVPTIGIDWLATVPPVVPDLWTGASPAPDAPFTTVANWNAYGGITYEGKHYGQKDEEFMGIIALPQCTPQKLELALSGASESVVQQLRAYGWTVRQANEEVSADVATYRSYILASHGEFSVAKHAYVETRSGWFSDRSVCYLAAGLPTILQNTGFSEWLQADRGVLPFSSVEEAAECIAQVNGDYEAHRHAARLIAEEIFSYKVVLPKLLERALSGSPSIPQAAQTEGVL